MKKQPEKVQIKQPVDKPVPTEIIAQSIVDISEGMKRIDNGSLNRRAILVLIKDASGVSFSEIERVLKTMRELKALYTQ